MATNTQTCANCEKSGLPILPVRYTVLPKYVKAGLPAGISGDRVTSVALEAHHYGVRTLREGWVYLFYEVGPRGSRYWEAYKVTSDGRLWKQALPLTQVPVTDPACAECAIAVPMDLIAIERPEKCTGRVFIAFSQHTWHRQIFDLYASDDALREARMQYIEPSKWIGGAQDAHKHAVVASEQTIDAVIEYMPGFDPRSMALPDDKQAFSDATGAYKDDLLQHEVTRYAPFIRQASPASASQALVRLMQRIGAKNEDGGSADAHHPPMVLALWDTIGTVHELNGFRCDPASWLDRYVTKERTLEVGALKDIDTAHAIVQSRTEQALNSQEAMAKQAQSMTALGQPGAQASLATQRAKALAGADPSRTSQINAYYDDMDWMAANDIPGSYQTQLVQMGRVSTAGSASSSVPYTGVYRDQVMSQARAYAQARPGAHDRNLTSMTTYNWSKYEARLKRQDIEKFRKYYDALQSKVHDLQEARTNDVGKWLASKLFLDTLEDYASNDLHDAIAFEIVVTDALAGIGSTPKGKTVLDTLVTHWDPVQPASLIWRVFAMNQKDARQEVAQLLKTALAKKETPLEAAQAQPAGGHSAGVDAVISAAGSLKTLNGYYKNLSKLALESDPKKITPLGGLLKRLEVDAFGLTVGDAIYSKFRVASLGDFVGEKIIQSLMLQRAGISYADAMTLVRKQADVEKVSRAETIERLLKTRSLLRSPAPPNASKATQALYDVWNSMKSTDEGIKALRSSRIAVVAALLEAVNFYKIMSGTHDKDTTLKLVQSGASMLSSLITITMTPFYGALKNSIKSQSWKLAGGGVSSIGTFVGAWMSVEQAADSGKKLQYDSLAFGLSQAVVGTAMGVATIIDAISTAAPLLKKLAVQYGTEVVIEAVEAVTKRMIAWAALRSVGMLIGWEATVGMIVLQTLATWLTPDSLQSWCSRCAFGTGEEAILRIKDHSVARYTDPSQQEKDYGDAMTTFS
ncbi:T6SS effector BTH_I2691 family protein [Paraburkholderia bannensis]|uniref:T6SS effector BTH_I2691 family protein n=1 Tax=Paraburkholderia bannensis TaxID=765414 RepID=UPI00047F504C|nr:T6SS effector BTH_I2691 family protein [Paraburkholderia bannensis]